MHQLLLSTFFTSFSRELIIISELEIFIRVSDLWSIQNPLKKENRLKELLSLAIMSFHKRSRSLNIRILFGLKLRLQLLTMSEKIRSGLVSLSMIFQYSDIDCINMK